MVSPILTAEQVDALAEDGSAAAVEAIEASHAALHVALADERTKTELLRAAIAEHVPHTHGLLIPSDPECSPDKPCLRCDLERSAE